MDKYEWFGFTDKDHIEIDFSVSENTSLDNKPLVCFQIYEYGTEEHAIGNILLDEENLDKLIKDLKRAEKYQHNLNVLYSKELFKC